MQRNFRNVTDLINRLAMEKKLISEMFYRRKQIDFSREDALHFTDTARLEFLINYGVIREEGDTLELEETYLHFFEEILQVNEQISSSGVADQLSLLKESIDFYLKERHNPAGQIKYLKRVKRTLRNIAQISYRNVVDLKRNVNDTFKHERNYQIKHDKLKRYLEQIIDINKLANDTRELLDSQNSTFENFSPDEQLSRIILSVSLELSEVNRNLIELQSVIRDYLHQIERQDKLIKKIRQLKALKDQLVWKASTDVCEVVGKLTDIFLEPSSPTPLKVSLQYLRETDSGSAVIAEVREHIRKSIRTIRKDDTPLTVSDLQQEHVVTDYVDIDVLATSFFGSGADLFSFVISYPFDSTQSLEQRVEYFTQITASYYERLRITDEWGQLIEKQKEISYPLIYAS